jgi:hypothetical protein
VKYIKLWYAEWQGRSYLNQSALEYLLNVLSCHPATLPRTWFETSYTIERRGTEFRKSGKWLTLWWSNLCAPDHTWPTQRPSLLIPQ